MLTPLSHSLSCTKIHHDDKPLSLDSLNQALLLLHKGNQQALLQVKSNNKLTTTPTNEPNLDSKWCIILVGLPASGKSSLCKNLIQHTTQRFHEHQISQYKIDTFNAGHFRRKMSDFRTQTADYFSMSNADARSQRETFAHIALEHLLNGLVGGQINVGIFDATNTTRARREYVFKTIREKELKTGSAINTIVLHVKCTDEAIWNFNVEGKTWGPDYVSFNHDAAIKDFLHRSELYQQAFEDITDEELEQYYECVYVQVDNNGKQVSIETNGYVDDHDLIFAELMEFFNACYQNYGHAYEERALQFQGKN